jgi:hypothetical protein
MKPGVVAVVMGLSFAVCVCTNAIASPLLFDSGPPTQQNGSEMTHWIEAGVFNVGKGAVLQSVQFWDLELSGAFQGSIIWQIYSNIGDSP